MLFRLKLLTLITSFFLSTSLIAETINYSVTASGGKYYIDGELQKELTLVPGNTYVFNGIPSFHPFRFSTTANGTHAGGSIYTDGVSETSNSVTIVVDENTPDLFYFCLYHGANGGMGSSAFITSVVEEENVPMLGGYFLILMSAVIFSIGLFFQRMKKIVN